MFELILLISAIWKCEFTKWIWSDAEDEYGNNSQNWIDYKGSETFSVEIDD